MADETPPAYAAAASTAHSGVHTLGFPTGYFLIRSMATGKVLDVSTNDTSDGTPLVLWNEKEKSLVSTLRDPAADNQVHTQVFFIDSSGSLCSKSSGHAIDIEGDHLVLRHRRPVTVPFPNAWSHPMPRFSYSPENGHITVTFTCDPTYPPPTSAAAQSTAWRKKEYLLTSIPTHKSRTLSEEAAELFASASSVLKSPFGLVLGRSRASTSTAAAFDLRGDEVLEADRREDEEDDSSSALHREVRMLPLPLGWMEKGGDTNPHARERRRWEILPVLREKGRRSTF